MYKNCYPPFNKEFCTPHSPLCSSASLLPSPLLPSCPPPPPPACSRFRVSSQATRTAKQGGGQMMGHRGILGGWAFSYGRGTPFPLVRGERNRGGGAMTWASTRRRVRAVSHVTDPASEQARPSRGWVLWCVVKLGPSGSSSSQHRRTPEIVL